MAVLAEHWTINLWGIIGYFTFVKTVAKAQDTMGVPQRKKSDSS